MPNTCSNCDKWQRVQNTSLKGGGELVGECRGGPPCGDFKFPRTRASDYCSAHSSHGGAVSFATAKPLQQGVALVEKLRASGMPVMAAPGGELFDAGERVAEPAAAGTAAITSPSTATAARPPASDSVPEVGPRNTRRARK